MSSYALNSAGDRIHARDGKHDAPYICPQCKELVHFVRDHTRMVFDRETGRKKTLVEPSFRHNPGSNCPFSKTESAEHQAMKAVWRDAFPNAEEEVWLPSGRRADLIITGHDGIRRSVECQYSPIDVATVSDRTREHNEDNLPIAWSFAPLRIKTDGFSMFDGVSEALDSSLWRTLKVAPTGAAFSSHIFCDMRFIDAPVVLDVPIKLGSTKLFDVKTKGRAVTVAERDDDAIRDAAKKARRDYLQLQGQHSQALDWMGRAKTFYDDPSDTEQWRKWFLERCREESGKITIPVGMSSKKYRLVCEKEKTKESAISSMPKGALEERLEEERWYQEALRRKSESEGYNGEK